MKFAKEINEFTWEDVVSASPGDVFVDRMEDGVRFVILRGPFHLCAYVGVPMDHPLAGFDYEAIPLRCHGGLTYGDSGTDRPLPAGRYWYGWDYGHCGDYSIHAGKLLGESGGKRWGVKDVDSDSWSAIYGFITLVRLAEAIARKK